MVNLEEKDVKKLKGRLGEVIDLQDINLPPARVYSPTETIRQIPEGCKQQFSATNFMGRSSVTSIVARLNVESGYEAYIVASIPGTNGIEYYIGHKGKENTNN